MNQIKPFKNQYQIKLEKGLSEKIVKTISQIKKEPAWMTEFRLKAFEIFRNKKMPDWGVNLSGINFYDISYYLSPLDKKNSWEEIPLEIRETYEKLGLPKAEREYLSGSSAQLESEVIYDSLKEEIAKKGVIFTDISTGLQKYPKLFKKYFATIIPPEDNALSALNSAVWSGGSFVYIPKDVVLELPLQAFFLINKEKVGQSERTLIIADENSKVHYIEGCTAPQYSTNSIHTGVVEIIVKKNATVRYTTIQNWSNNIYNLTTQRARVEENGVMQWIDSNLGSKKTMKYPSCILAGKKAKGQVLSLSTASHDQHQDTGAKMIHLAPETSSQIISKSISMKGATSSFRGLVYIDEKAINSQASVSCDTMILDPNSYSHTYPAIKINNSESQVEHEAKIEKIDEEKLFYLNTKGLRKEEAESLLVNGFIENILKEIPLEYAVEINALINMNMKNSIG